MASAAQEMGQHAAEIRISHLSKQFGDLYAVHNVSLHIQKGDFCTLLGPSGCGKTTLLRMIAGFTQPDTGDIFFDDQRVNDLPPWKRDVGMVFQNFALWPHLSVFDNIAFGLRERKLPKSQIREKVYGALQLVDLEGVEHRRPSQLSGGQQQRVALARTLIVEPRGLLLDEPLSSLDAQLRVQMGHELVRLQQDLGITTIYVTHDQEEALALSTKIAVFSNGRLIQEGTPKEVYEGPRAHAVADFVGTSNFLEGTITEVVGDRISMCVREDLLLHASWQPSFETAPQPGEPILLCIRPESIQMSEETNEAAENRIPGQVQSYTYLGSQIQYAVNIGMDQPMKINLPNPRRLSILPADTPVHLIFSPHDAVLLPAEGGESKGRNTN
jgi:ABC-type Fe3+/spermidine/putrescine transport system ATPase subunit